MAEILTSNFKTDTTRKFVKEVLNSKYYVIASGIEKSQSSNSLRSKNSLLERTLFGKQVNNSSDVKFMIRYFPWQSGSTYVQYDDTIDLEDLKFYAVVGPNENNTGDYRVYKCLYNNNNAVVASAPNFEATTTGQIYRTSDGYVWKHMYAITEIQFEAYNSLGYMPIIGPTELPDADAENPWFDPKPSTTGSPLSEIIVENQSSNFGYTVENASLSGSPFALVQGGTVNTMNVNQRDVTLNPTLDYYVGSAIFITNPNGDSLLRTIISYTYFESAQFAEITVAGDIGTVPSNAIIRILPRIEILGDGTGAEAIANVRNGRIDTITIINAGTEYNNIEVRVVDPLVNFTPNDVNSTDNRAVIRGILSPQDGHGTNLVDELRCKHWLLYAFITQDNNNNIGATNNYSTVGIIRDPSFNDLDGDLITDDNLYPVVFDNRIKITTSDINQVVVNTRIIQVNVENEITFSGVVHEVDTTNNTFFIAEYNGPYATGGSDISLDASRSFRNATDQSISINSVTVSPYIQRTGKVYFLEDFIPLPRTNLSREEFKFVLEF
jgi:hypothetical protein